MTRQELLEKIENGRDILFEAAGKYYTILTWWETGILIAEQNTEAHKAVFESAGELLQNYRIDGASLGELAESVRITDYS